MRAGERRKLHRNLQENVFARQVGVVGLLLCLRSIPVLACLLLFVGVSFATSGEHTTGASLAFAALPGMVMGSSNILALRQKKTTLVKAQRTLLNTIHSEGRDFSESESATYEDNIKALEAIEKNLEREERLMVAERGMGSLNADDMPENAGVGEGKKFATLGEQLLAVVNAENRGRGNHADPRLFKAAASGANENVGSEGGFVVQTDFSSELLKRTYSLGEVSSRVRRIPVSGSGLKINAIDETSRANGSRYGGIQAYWIGEADQFTATKPKFRQLELNLRKLTGLCYATDELLADASALQSLIEQAFPEELNFKVEDAIINGAGAGMPLGILNSGCLVTVNKETSQAASTVVAENVLKMFARLWPRSQANAVWYVNNDVLPQLPQLNIKIKNVAGTENVGGILTPIYQFPNNSNSYGSILGRPVIPVEYCASLTNLGDIILADMSQYLMIDKGGVQSDSSMHVRFLYDEMTFRFIYRCDGQPIWNSALTPKNGSNTLSPFVTLQAR